jgi:nucleotide-binding universal stress UspA family protein
MMRFGNILLLAGGDSGSIPQDVLKRAIDLAKRNEAKLTLVDVVRELDLFREILPREMLEGVREERREALSRLASIARDDGVEAETDLIVGRPFIEIIRRVQRRGHDLVMTDGGRGRSAKGVIDSVTMQLMRKCPCAIWVVRPLARGRYARILAAVDPQVSDPEKVPLSRRVMKLAISMAEMEGSELHVVHVWETLELPQGASPEAWRHWEITARREVKRDLHRFMQEFRLREEPQVHFIVGRPAGRIPEVAVKESIDLLVMGTVQRTGVRGFFIGHTAEEVLGRVSCSLLTVKPDSFVSPV